MLGSFRSSTHIGEAAADQIADAGADRLRPLRIARRALPMVAPAMALSGILFAPEAYGLWKDVIEAAPERMYPVILTRFRGGAGAAAADYVKASSMTAVMRECMPDLGAMPPPPQPPPPKE